MTPFNALEYLKNRIIRLSLNHKLGNRDIAELEVKEIVMGIETHVIPTLEKALERAKKEHELLELYRLKDDLIEEYQVNDSLLERQQTLGAIQGVREEIKALEEETK